MARIALTPWLNLRFGFATPPVVGADFRAALVASCFLGALFPVLFLAAAKSQLEIQLTTLKINFTLLGPGHWSLFLLFDDQTLI